MNATIRFDPAEALPILRRTPGVLRTLLHGIPEPWIHATEGPDTWSPFDVVGHLIHGERTDWLSRVQHILTHGDRLPFPVFDRFAQFEASKGKALPELLDTFAELRAANLERFTTLGLTPADLDRTGLHPALGPVTLGQHLATWVAHDLGHLAQVSRVMAKRYREAVGPWREYLPILDRG